MQRLTPFALIFLTSCLLGGRGVVGADFLHPARNAASCSVRKRPSFVQGASLCINGLATTVQVRGGSDDPGGYYYNDDEYKRDNANLPDYGYREDSRRSDDYYGEEVNYFEDDGRYERDYDDRGTTRRKTSSMSSLPSLLREGDRTVGLVLLSFGAFFTISGLFLFFHKTLLRLGNLLMIAGVPMTIGPGRTAGFFLQPQKARATGFLVFGIFLVFIGWPIFGMALEVFGIMNLFGNMLPFAIGTLRQMFGAFLPKQTNKKSVNRRNYDDRYGDRDDDRYSSYNRDDGKYY